MARGIDDIFNEIITAKEAEPGLSALTSTSSVALWRLWAYITAVAIYSLEMLMDVFKAELQAWVDAKTPGSLTWYRQKALEFRYGSHLVIENGKPGYAFSNTTPPLVAQCSVREAENGLIVKIAKEANGQLVPLSDNELDAFVTYMSAVKYAGTMIRFINGDAVKLHANIDVYYDSLLLDKDGTAIIGGNSPVADALHAFLRHLPFDGRLTRNELLVAIRSAEGVKDIVIQSLQQQTAGNAAQNIEVYHIPYSGYFAVETLSITYIAYV